MFPALDLTLANVYFAGLALATLCCAVGVLVSRHPLNAAVLLVGAMLALSGIYALLDAPFLAVLQVLVYAGAVMMLVIFVIMVLNRARDDRLPRFDAWSVATAAAPLALTALLAFTLAGQKLAVAPGAMRGEPVPIAARMFAMDGGATAVGGWWLLFVAVGITLLVAVVGAVLLAKRTLDTPAEAPAKEEAGHAH
jgi:NADH-quinone oxidoreductase subunit J